MSPHLRGHLLLFDRPPASALKPDGRLVVAAFLVEAVRVVTPRWIAPGLPLWLFVSGLLLLALLLVWGHDRLTPDELGLRPWRAWSLTERSYLIQVVIIALVVFPLVLAPPIGVLAASGELTWSLSTVFAPYLLFGFYQELVYRGFVQHELVRRWGAPAGILVANLLFTFGPLHWHYLASPLSTALPMLAGIFAIGLFFGVVYQRSGNLWIVGIFHAIGNAYIVWSVGLHPLRAL